MRCAFTPNMSLVTKLVHGNGKMLSFYVSLCRQTDGWTTVKQYAPDLLIRGHKKRKKKLKKKKKKASRCQYLAAVAFENRLTFKESFKLNRGHNCQNYVADYLPSCKGSSLDNKQLVSVWSKYFQ